MSAGLLDLDAAANLLGVAPKELQKLASDGVIPRQSGKFHPVQLVRAYTDHIKKSNDLLRPGTQEEIAERTGQSTRNLRDQLQRLGIDHRTTPMVEVVRRIVEDLREKAAGRGGGDAQAEAAQARMEKDRAQTAMLRLGYHKELKTLIVADDAEAALIDWAGYASREYSTGVDKLVLELESTHGIEIDRDQVKDIVSPTVERIQSYAAKLGAGLVSGGGSIHATEAGGNSAVD